MMMFEEMHTFYEFTKMMVDAFLIASIKCTNDSLSSFGDNWQEFLHEITQEYSYHYQMHLKEILDESLEIIYSTPSTIIVNILKERS